MTGKLAASSDAGLLSRERHVVSWYGVLRHQRETARFHYPCTIGSALHVMLTLCCRLDEVIVNWLRVLQMVLTYYRI